MKLLNQKGLSLVEIVVSLGLLGGLGLVVMNTQTTASKAKLKENVSQIVTDASRTIQKALNNRAACSLTLQGYKVGDEIPVIKDGKVDPNNFDSFIESSEPAIKKTLQKRVIIEKYELVDIDGKDFLKVEFNLDPDDSKNIGSKFITKNFSINGIKNGLGQYTACYSETGNQSLTAATVSCKGMGGTMVGGNCQYLNNIVDDSKADCGPGASYQLKIQSGKIKMGCTPCTPVKKFIEWKCEKGKFQGGNWFNVCYYRSGCSENPGALYGVQFYEQGPSRASGGDTGSKRNCKKKRRKCSGE